MDDETPTLAVPKAQFINHVCALAREGEIRDERSEQVREKQRAYEVVHPRNVVEVDATDDEEVRLFLKTNSTESERVARATHWQPAEYKNHDVTVFGTVTMEWPEDEPRLPETTVLLEQEGGKPTPPDPEPYDI